MAVSSHPAGLGGSCLVGRGGACPAVGGEGGRRLIKGHLLVIWGPLGAACLAPAAPVRLQTQRGHETNTGGSSGAVLNLLELLLGLSTGQKGFGKGNQAVAAGCRPVLPSPYAAPCSPALAGLRRDSHGSSRRDQGAFLRGKSFSSLSHQLPWGELSSVCLLICADL